MRKSDKNAGSIFAWLRKSVTNRKTANAMLKNLQGSSSHKFGSLPNAGIMRDWINNFLKK
jgi:hypothetical protein